MKIAVVARHVETFEGVPTYVAALARALATSHEVTVFSATFDARDATGVRHRRVRALGRCGVLFHVTFFISSTLMLWRCRLKKSFDIIHSHHYASPFFTDVITSHNCEREAFAQMRCHKGGRPPTNPVQRLQSLSWALIERGLFEWCKSKPLIVPSEGMRRDFLHHYSISAENIFVIPAGVDSSRHNPENVPLYRQEIRCRHSLVERDLIVLLVGGDWPRKGVAQAIEAVSRLGSYPVKLLIVGSGSTAIYQKLARDLGTGEKVIFTGPTRETWKYYAAADIFLLPTLYDAFGLSILEAMATGLPVVVSRNAGAAELIQDGVNGVLLENPSDVDEVETKLKLLLRDSRMRARLGEKALNTALQYTWFQVAQRHAETYRRVLDQHKERAFDGKDTLQTEEGANHYAWTQPAQGVSSSEVPIRRTGNLRLGWSCRNEKGPSASNDGSFDEPSLGKGTTSHDLGNIDMATPGIKVSVIMPVLNEERSVDEFLRSLCVDRTRPDEIIIVDDGSRDRTRDIVRSYEGCLPLKLILAEGESISRCRNIAIAAAKGDIIIARDTGVTLIDDWIKHLTSPFATGDGVLPGYKSKQVARSSPRPVSVVSGYITGDPRTVFEEAICSVVTPRVNQVDPQKYVPSKCIAFLKEAWRDVGGYPEWLDFCEDVGFVNELARRGHYFAWQPNVVVYSRPRTSLSDLARQKYLYARGDGKADLQRRQNLGRYVVYIFFVCAIVIGIRFAPFWSLPVPIIVYYLAPAYRRLASQMEKWGVRDLVKGFCWIPIIRLTTDFARMAGYLVGVWWRLTKRGRV